MVKVPESAYLSGIRPLLEKLRRELSSSCVIRKFFANPPFIHNSFFNDPQK